MDPDLPRKLGLKPGQRVLSVNVPHDVEPYLQKAVKAEWLASGSRAAGVDVILWAPASPAQLKTLFKGLARRIQPGGKVWVFIPKKPFARDAARELTQGLVIAAGKSAGLVDNKVCRVDEVHYALQFVVPVSARP